MTVAINNAVHANHETSLAALPTNGRALPELTFKAILFGFILAMILCASNIYVALKVGRTIAASIPAAVLSILFLGLWKKTSILEHNIVQTTASAGDVVSAGITFTIPAMVLMNVWDHFHYFETVAIAIIGGFLGLAFSVPLRRSMLLQQKLPYPEGIAAAEVLKSGTSKGSGGALVIGGTCAAIYSFMQEGAKWLIGEIQLWTRAGTIPFGTGFDLSPVLVGAGYIVGLRISSAMLLGSVITWVIAIPLYTYLFGAPEAATSAKEAAFLIWKTKMKFIGVGAMIVGGFWGIFSLAKTMKDALLMAIQSFGQPEKETSSLPLAERDLPMKYVGMIIVALCVPVLILFYGMLVQPVELGTIHGLIVALAAVVISLVIAFGCAVVGSYLTGIVGSTLVPISGVTISGILLFGSFVYIAFAGQVDFSINSSHALSVASATIMFAAIVALASGVSGDNMQDLKAGLLIGATPWKQQVMLLAGIVGGAIVCAPVLDTLFSAYGFGDVMPRPDMDPTKTLNAPQAMMMATMAKGLFAGGIEWTMITIGAVIGIFIIGLDQYLKTKGKENRLPVLSVALGMYIPAAAILTFMAGGLVGHFAQKRRASLSAEAKAKAEGNGVLFSSGVIAGTALMGLFIAIPLAQGYDISTYLPTLPTELVTIGGLFVFGWLLYAIYQKGSKAE